MRSFWDGTIVWGEAIAYVVLYACYIGYLALDNKRRYNHHKEIDEVAAEIEHIEEEAEKKYPFLQLIDSVIELTYPK
jgi:hypothetical protein